MVQECRKRLGLLLVSDFSPDLALVGWIYSTWRHANQIQNHEPEFEVGFPRLPAEESPLNPNEKKTLEKVAVVGLPGMQAGDMSPHDVTSWARA